MSNITPKELWISNVCKQALNLSDIGVVIQPGKHINLLDKKH